MALTGRLVREPDGTYSALIPFADDGDGVEILPGALDAGLRAFEESSNRLRSMFLEGIGQGEPPYQAPPVFGTWSNSTA